MKMQLSLLLKEPHLELPVPLKMPNRIQTFTIIKNNQF